MVKNNIIMIIFKDMFKKNHTSIYNSLLRIIKKMKKYDLSLF